MADHAREQACTCDPGLPRPMVDALCVVHGNRAPEPGREQAPEGWVPLGTHAGLDVVPPLRLSDDLHQDGLPLWEQPLAVEGRGTGAVACCGHRNRCLFGHMHRWSTLHVQGVYLGDGVCGCDKCGAVCVAERDEDAVNAAGDPVSPATAREQA